MKRNLPDSNEVQELKRSARVVYLSTLSAGDYFCFENMPDGVFKVVRKYPNVFVIKSVSQSNQKTIPYYPKPSDTEENKVRKILRKPA